MATDFSTAAFIEELESFGRPPPPRPLITEHRASPCPSEIVSKLNQLNIEKQKKMRSSPINTNSGMASLGSKLEPRIKSEISKEEANGLRQAVISATRPKNPWALIEHESPESGRRFAKEVSEGTQHYSVMHSSKNTLYPHSKSNSYLDHRSDYSSQSSVKSPSPPTTASTSFSPRSDFPSMSRRLSPERYNGVCEGPKMIGTTYRYGTEGEKTTFPKVDILSSSPSDFPSNPSPIKTQKSIEDKKKIGRTLHNHSVHSNLFGEVKKWNADESTDSERKVARWRQMQSELEAQDENFGRITKAFGSKLNQERVTQMAAAFAGACGECGRQLLLHEEIICAGDTKFHPKCFKCRRCGRNLKELKFYLADGEIVCQEDFLLAELHKKAEKCDACGNPIVEMVLQAIGKSFHPKCFKCCICNKCLDGEQFAADPNDQVYCVADFHAQFAPRCSSCTRPIVPAAGSNETVRVVALDRSFHVECFCCQGCGIRLGDEFNERCYPLGDTLLCKRCHTLHRQTGGAPTTDL